jgi:regulator of sirC expression with transglutaminase-like and TPR domain
MILPPRPRFYFEQALQQPQIDLAIAALYIAQSEYPSLDVNHCLQQLDQMADAVAQNLPTERYPLKVVQTINHYLYDYLGFKGDQATYYDPDNSFLNRVLERRAGIPITLSLVYLEVAKRLDFPMLGIGFPGHFLIRPDAPEIEIHVDPFNGGEILFPQDCFDRLQQIYGKEMTLQPEFFQPVTPQQFLWRMLGNLKQIYLQHQDWERALSMVEHLLLVDPDAQEQRRDRGLLHYQLQNWAAAKQDLHAYLNHHPTPGDVQELQALLLQLTFLDGEN